MKAVIEENDGLYIIRINGNEGALYDVHVVEGIEFKRENQDQSLVLRPDILKANLKGGDKDVSKI